MNIFEKLLALGVGICCLCCETPRKNTDEAALGPLYEVYNQTLPFVHDTCSIFCFQVWLPSPAAYPPRSRIRYDSARVAQSIRQKRLNQDFDFVLTYDSLFIETNESFSELIKRGSLFQALPGIPRAFYGALVNMAESPVTPSYWQASRLSIPAFIHLLPYEKAFSSKKPTIWLGAFKLGRVGVDAKNGKACYLYSLTGDVFREKLVLVEKRKGKWVVVKEIITGMS